MCLEKWHYFFMHLMENLAPGSLHHWGKKPHDPLAQWTLETGQKKSVLLGNELLVFQVFSWWPSHRTDGTVVCFCETCKRHEP